MLQKCRNYFSQTYEDIIVASYENLPLWGINIKPKEPADEKDIDKINSVLRKYRPTADLWFFCKYEKKAGYRS
jgi:hypothetical protein